MCIKDKALPLTILWLLMFLIIYSGNILCNSEKEFFRVVWELAKKNFNSFLIGVGFDNNYCVCLIFKFTYYLVKNK